MACVLRCVSTMYSSLAQGHGDARADVVAERDRPHQPRPVDPELLTHGQRRRTTDPGCDCENGCVSSVSSEWASIPFTSAASMGPHITSEPAMVAIRRPCRPAQTGSRRRPGGSSEPKSWPRTCQNCVLGPLGHFFRSARPPASLIYELSAVMIWLTSPSANNGGQPRGGGHHRAFSGDCGGSGEAASSSFSSRRNNVITPKPLTRK